MFREMKKRKEKSELEQVSDYMTFIEYRVWTKDKICLVCRADLREWVSPTCRWYGEIMMKTSWIIPNLEGKEVLLRTSEQPHDLEYCIKLMNDYIRDNFKTRLD